MGIVSLLVVLRLPVHVPLNCVAEGSKTSAPTDYWYNALLPG